MGFAHLHVHTSSGSMLDSVVTPLELAKRAAEFGHKYLACTDHGSCAGWYDHQTACNSIGIKPILGLEQYVIPDEELVTLNDKGKRIRCKNNHLILLAKNKTGLENIMHLHYISMHDENHFYYNNHSTFSEIFKYSEGIVCGTACMMSPFSNALKIGNSEKAEQIFKQFLDVFKDDFYVEVQLNELTKPIDGLECGQKSTNDFMMQLADKYGVPKVITGDVHYLDREDYKLQDISIAMREKRTSEMKGFSLDSHSLFYHDVSDYKFFNKQFGYNYDEDLIDEMCNNTEIIASKCDAYIPERVKMIFPTVTPNDEYEMEVRSKTNLAKKFGVENYKDAPQEYVERLDYEMALLKKKGFGSYIMVLADIFDHCKEAKIPVGYARGSGGGSLVLYLMGITKIDPIKYELSFHRFVNEARCTNNVFDYFSEE